jgi:hypothetical protein
MTDLESRYRWLFAAYPPAHRAEREEEMITTLLDVAAPGQTRPTLREAGAIVGNGLACRARSATEWREGLRLASFAALVLATMLAVAALGVAALPPIAEPVWPMDPARVQLAVWALALAAIAAGTHRAWGRRRIILPLASATVMLGGGAATTGMPRSTYVASFLLLLTLSTSGPAFSVRARMGAVVIGATAGAALFYRFVVQYRSEEVNQWFGDGAVRAWERWAVASWLVPVRPGLWLLGVLLGFLTGTFRPRFAVATALLATPVALLTVQYSRLGDIEAIVLPVLLGVLVLLVTAAARSRSQRPEQPVDAAAN